MNRGVMYLALLGVLVFVLSVFATAAPTAPTALNQISSTQRNLNDLASQTINAQGGNVTEVNLIALTITKSWQGYYGEVSGTITLDDNRNFTFYNWTLTSVGGEVYATRNATVTWSNTNIMCANSTHLVQEEGELGQSATDADSVRNTFSKLLHPTLTIGPRTIAANTCNSTNAFVNNASQNSNFVQVLLHQNDSNPNNIIYATIINDTTAGFDSETHDFQLLVGENEHTGSEGVTTYYFWVELN